MNNVQIIKQHFIGFERNSRIIYVRRYLDPLTKGAHGADLLHLAITKNCNAEIIHMLATRHNCVGQLHRAIFFGRPCDVLAVLVPLSDLNKGVDSTPIHVALAKYPNDPDVIRLFVPTKQNVLFYALALKCSPEVVELLVTPINVEDLNDDGLTPLLLAIVYGYKSPTLLKKLITPNTIIHGSPLALAVRNSASREVLCILLDALGKCWLHLECFGEDLDVSIIDEINLQYLIHVMMCVDAPTDVQLYITSWVQVRKRDSVKRKHIDVSSLRVFR